VNRLLSISPGELRFRARALARRQKQRAAVAIHGSSWQRVSIADVLTPGVLGPDANAAIEQDRWQDVEQRLRQVLRDRPSRFVLDPRSVLTLRHAILARSPDAPARAAAIADPLCQGEFNLLGWKRLSFESPVARTDWHWDPVHGRRMPSRFWADVPFLDPNCGDHKIIWELNRHQFLVPLGRAWWLTGDRRYAQAIIDYVQDWLESNPPLVGINWASMLELAFRSLSWLTAMHFLLADPNHTSTSLRAATEDETPWLVDMCVGLERQLTHVEQNLSYYYSPNTHLTGEALALYVAGVALPEFARSAQWVDVGRHVLLTEVHRQILSDGGHAERSTHYHRYTLDFYALALLTAERAGDVEAVTVFSDAVSRLERFMRAVADDHGRIPLIGDDDGGMLWRITDREPHDVRDSLALADVLLNRTHGAGKLPEEVLWLAWSRRASALQARRHTAADREAEPHPTHRPTIRATAFADTGYVAVRSHRGDHLVFDAGPHGFLNGGHAHADALSLTLTLGSQPFLIDPGTGTYTMDRDLRDRMRATSSHNTVTLDGHASAVPSGPFKWKSRADARLTTWRCNSGFAWAEACHDAFTNARHRRSVIYSEAGGCLIVDEILGDGEHAATTHWHFDPRWRVRCDGSRRLCATADDRTAWLLSDHGTLALLSGDESGVGWCSPCYGALVPTSTAHLTHTGRGSFSMIAWLGAARAVPPPALERIALESDAFSPALGVRVCHDTQVTVTVVRPGSIARTERSCATPDYHTDARFLQYSCDERGMMALSVADGTLALAHDERVLSVRSEIPIADLHVVHREGCLELYSTSPPSELYLHGAAVASAVLVRLNGRDVRVRDAERSGSLTVTSAQWRDTAPERPLLRRATDRHGVPEPELAGYPVWRRS
jgi:uncharacterized heparinase superfamily protein